jgi:hypothetical protein
MAKGHMNCGMSLARERWNPATRVPEKVPRKRMSKQEEEYWFRKMRQVTREADRLRRKMRGKRVLMDLTNKG